MIPLVLRELCVPLNTKGIIYLFCTTLICLAHPKFYFSKTVCRISCFSLNFLNETGTNKQNRVQIKELIIPFRQCDLTMRNLYLECA